jgi:hypothetical protein
VPIRETHDYSTKALMAQRLVPQDATITGA